MEELAGVDRLGVDPLHLLQQADGEGIRHAVARAGGHGVDELVVLILLAEGLRALGELRLVGLVNLAQIVAGLDGALILLVGLQHVQDGEHETVEHAVVVVARIGLGAPDVGNRMLGRLPQRGIHAVGEADGQRALVAGELGRAGILTAEEARTHPRRNIITRALGTEGDNTPDLLAADLQPGDRFLLCTAGLTGMVRDDEIEKTLLDSQTADEAADRLIQMALDAGGSDNVTLILCTGEEGKPWKQD